ncbi:MAG TPA: response regulator [Verrucomicrobiae bacterium]|nr:response regulator [Verrucomicrobiae bacterium]
MSGTAVRQKCARALRNPIVVARHDSKPLVVLHVEDDDNDALLLRKACERACIAVSVQRVSDAEEAMQYLAGGGAFADRAAHPLPNIVILDLRLPSLNGFDLLQWVRARAEFQRLPILVFTSSLSRDDKSRAMAAGANSFFVKPASFECLVQLVGCFPAASQPKLI